jgi:hypothetical protein
VEFMLMFNEPEGLTTPDPDCMVVMGKFAQGLVREKKLRRGFPLEGAAEAATVRVRDGQPVVKDGPFAETKEQIAGVWIIDAADRAEVLEIARRIPHLNGGPIEVHALGGRYGATDSEKGKPFILVFRLDPGHVFDPAKGREMMEFGTALQNDGTQFETGHLTGNPRPARLESKSGKTFVTDGPFAETKEGVGGYSLIRVPSRAAAIEIAKRYPHAKWGTVEVREVLFFDRV